MDIVILVAMAFTQTSSSMHYAFVMVNQVFAIPPVTRQLYSTTPVTSPYCIHRVSYDIH